MLHVKCDLRDLTGKVCHSQADDPAWKQLNPVVRWRHEFKMKILLKRQTILE